MKPTRAFHSIVGLLFLTGLAAAPGCGSSEDLDLATSSGNPSGSSASGSATGTGAGGGGGGGGGEGQGGSGMGGSGGSAAVVSDPDKDGPYEYKEIDDTITSPSGNQVPIHCAYPTAGPDAGPYPVIVVAHGLQITPDLYHGYIKRLATFGYVALTADFPANAFGEVSNTKNAQDLIAALDWADQESKTAGSPLEGKANAGLAGMTGHSLGGKLALLAATQDARVKASITLDPVDGGGGPGGGCMEPACFDVSAKMGTLKIPTAFLGEILDETGQFGQACAPKDQNYTTFYAPASPPSLSVTVNGAAHMSFLDNPDCGFACFACKTASAEHAKVIGLARAYVVAFYERHLRGLAGYDTYLTGAEAKARYIDPGLASIESK